MKKQREKWKRWAALLLAGLLLLCCAPGFGASAAVSRKNVYFMALNDTILELREDTMPFTANGDIYVPYTVFDPNVTGINLGVYTVYSSNVVAIYGRVSEALVFDLGQDTAVSSGGTRYTKRAIRHNSTIFVPVDMVVNFFGLSWTALVDGDSGMIVRVKSQSAQIEDGEFPSAARHILDSRYEAYVRSMTVPDPVAEPSPSASPAAPSASQPPSPPPATPTPAPSSSPSPAPSASQPPSPAQSEPPQPEGGDVYLAVRCGPGGNTAALAAALREQNAYGLFFFPAEELVSREDEVRGLSAAGHKIGLLLDGESPEERQEQAERGRALLKHILRAQADIVLLPEGADDGEAAKNAENAEGVEQAETAKNAEAAEDAKNAKNAEDWLSWRADLDGTPGGRASAQQLREILADAVHPEDCFLLLDDGAQTAGIASRLLRELAQAGCTFRLSLEPMLSA